ncbi:MAG TPA: cation:proton antiporter [Gemmatimonadaceae bacterium]|nr:cation:proton antiporter [Gemmatimonadaceae bacterium]
MPHDSTLIATIAGAFVLAFVLGLVATRLRLTPVVGYLVAGVVMGPFTPGFTGDASVAGQLAEIGVILLMFGVGMHFSLRDILAARKVALPGALLQIAVATALGALLGRQWGWSWTGAAVFGLSLSVASTVVVLRALEPRGILDTPDGRLTVGWLVVEDLAMVIALVLVPPFVAGQSAGGTVGAAIAVTFFKVVAFVALMLVVGARVVPWALTLVARSGSRELFTLAVLGLAIGVALGAAELFGVSFALGAFVAGLVVSESDVSHQAAADALPFQDAFAVLFFVSVGMLVNPMVFVHDAARIAVVLAVVFVGQALVACALVLALGQPLRTALTLGAAVGQIGEFSFIVIALGISLGVLPAEARGLVLASAIASITINPLLFAAIEPVERFFDRHPRLLGRVQRWSVTMNTTMEMSPDADTGRTGHAIIVGYGRVGSTIGEVLKGEGLPFVAIDRDRVRVEQMREQGVNAIFGDAAARGGVLRYAGIAGARILIVTAPEPIRAHLVVDEARRLRADIPIVVRVHSEAEFATFQRLGVERVVLGERELAFGMARYALQALRR